MKKTLLKYDLDPCNGSGFESCEYLDDGDDNCNKIGNLVCRLSSKGNRCYPKFCFDFIPLTSGNPVKLTTDLSICLIRGDPCEGQSKNCEDEEVCLYDS